MSPPALPFARYAMWLDGIGSPARVNDASLLVATVAELARLTGLDLHSTQVARVGEGPQHVVSCQGLIVQSHITLHGWRDSGGLMADVVSCQPWDYDAGRAYLVERFDIRRVLRYSDTGRQANLALAARV